jgi:hypothetical protein
VPRGPTTAEFAKTIGRVHIGVFADLGSRTRMTERPGRATHSTRDSLLGWSRHPIGRRAVPIVFGCGATICTVPLMSVPGSASSPVAPFMLRLFALAIVSGYSAVNAEVKAELVPTEVRALGVESPCSVAVALCGATAE